jgi:hypothetical protein
MAALAYTATGGSGKSLVHLRRNYLVVAFRFERCQARCIELTRLNVIAQACAKGKCGMSASYIRFLRSQKQFAQYTLLNGSSQGKRYASKHPHLDQSRHC